MQEAVVEGSGEGRNEDFDRILCGGDSGFGIWRRLSGGGGVDEEEYKRENAEERECDEE